MKKKGLIFLFRQENILHRMLQIFYDLGKHFLGRQICFPHNSQLLRVRFLGLSRKKIIFCKFSNSDANILLSTISQRELIEVGVTWYRGVKRENIVNYKTVWGQAFRPPVIRFCQSKLAGNKICQMFLWLSCPCPIQFSLRPGSVWSFVGPFTGPQQ